MTIAEYLKKYLTIQDKGKLKETERLSVSEIWEMIAKRKNFSEMGFDSQSNYESWVRDNPYSSL